MNLFTTTNYSYYKLLMLLSSIVSCVYSQALPVCQYVQLSGALYHNGTNGIFTLSKDIHCNSKPAWVDPASKHYIYYLLDGYDGWMVSPTSCYHWGNFMIKAKSDADTPYDVTEGWSEYSPNDAEWKVSETISITCSATGPTAKCSSLTCLPGSECVVRSGQAACECKPGYILFGDECRSASQSGLATHCRQLVCMEGSLCVEKEGSAKCECEPDYTLIGDECHITSKGIRGFNLFILICSAAVGTVLITMAVLLIIKYHKKQILPNDSPKRGIFKYRPLENSSVLD